MSRVILLDSGPLGLATHPKGGDRTRACLRWMQERFRSGDAVVIPEIADYEIRRELLRAGRSRGIANLNSLSATFEYLPISTDAIRHAAHFWAEARRSGRPTAPPEAIDADVILAGQAAALNSDRAIVATTNPGHISRFVPAHLWEYIV